MLEPGSSRLQSLDALLSSQKPKGASLSSEDAHVARTMQIIREDTLALCKVIKLNMSDRDLYNDSLTPDKLQAMVDLAEGINSKLREVLHSRKFRLGTEPKVNQNLVGLITAANIHADSPVFLS
ncbi:hypothetical protein HJFPF1_02478 [Paramyrothecium foliicola]|nr:hypothetical protein HJFPF1_02478 [Paramyrothecium foliicola]